jgi:hypothetical protein
MFENEKKEFLKILTEKDQALTEMQKELEELRRRLGDK